MSRWLSVPRGSGSGLWSKPLPVWVSRVKPCAHQVIMVTRCCPVGVGTEAGVGYREGVAGPQVERVGLGDSHKWQRKGPRVMWSRIFGEQLWGL